MPFYCYKFFWLLACLRYQAVQSLGSTACCSLLYGGPMGYVLVAIIKKLLCIDQSLYTILQILSLTLFDEK